MRLTTMILGTCLLAHPISVYLMGNDRDTDATVDYRIDLSIQWSTPQSRAHPPI